MWLGILQTINIETKDRTLDTIKLSCWNCKCHSFYPIEGTVCFLLKVSSKTIWSFWLTIFSLRYPVYVANLLFFRSLRLELTKLGTYLSTNYHLSSFSKTFRSIILKQFWPLSLNACLGPDLYGPYNTLENYCTGTAQSLLVGCSQWMHKIVNLAVKKGIILVNILLL